MSRRQVPTPAGNGQRLCEVWKGGLDLNSAEETIRGLPAHLQREAAVDLQRRVQPVLTEWLQQWDTDDGELEPEEPVSDEEFQAESPLKRPRHVKSGDAAPARPMPLPDGYPQHSWPIE